MKAYAMIPARAGSKGLPDKNILQIAGHPLLAHAVAFAKKTKVDLVVVSSDSPAYLEIAQAYGADLCILRGPFASSDTAMEEAVVEDFVLNKPPLVGEPDLWVWLKPTAPLRSVSSVDYAIQTLRESPLVSAVRVVSEADARLHIVDAEGMLRPWVGELWPAGRSKIRRTEVPKVFRPFNLEVFRHANWQRYGAGFMGDAVLPVFEAKFTGLDIDDHHDFAMLQALIEARPDFLRPYVHL